jgi:hypothetical protein
MHQAGRSCTSFCKPTSEVTHLISGGWPPAWLSGWELHLALPVKKFLAGPQKMVNHMREISDGEHIFKFGVSIDTLYPSCPWVACTKHANTAVSSPEVSFTRAILE